LVGSGLCFFNGTTASQIGLPAGLVGEAGIALGFFPFGFKSYVRSTVNAVFVLGAFFVLMGVDAVSENWLMDLCAIGAIFFWLFTRISISKWNNRRICATCALCGLKGLVPAASASEGSDYYKQSEQDYDERPPRNVDFV
jgi:hypothetical protein